MVGEGGFSVVYRGHHLGLDEPIAIKCLKLPGALGSALVESFVRRFRDESRLHYRLSQGNLHIARSIASGTTMAPATSALVPYMVLEWLDGRSLAEDFNIRRAQGHRGRPLAEVVKLLDPAVDAIAFAHAQGVVHRDLNPGNIFLASTRQGLRIKVLDFGVAKVVSDHALEAMRDRTVMEGEHIGEYAMRALEPSVRPTPRRLGLPVGDEVEAIFARAMAVNPADRPQDAGQFWGALKHAMQTDAASGKAPHANVGQAAQPQPQPQQRTLFMNMPPPAVEVTRQPTPTPPPAQSPGRKFGGTVRMEASPVRSGAQALSQTPLPPPPQNLEDTATEVVRYDFQSGQVSAQYVQPRDQPSQPQQPVGYPAYPQQDVSGQYRSQPYHSPSHPTVPPTGQAPTISNPPPAYAPASLEPAEVPRSKGAVWAILIGLVLLMLVGAGVAVYVFVIRKPAPPPPVSTSTTTAKTPTTAATPTATASTAPAPSETPSAAPTASSAPSATVPTATATVTTPLPFPTTTATVTAKPDASAPVDPRAFNRDAAMGQLNAINNVLASCRQEGGPSGSGGITVTFNTDGSVASAVLSGPPFAGTPVGECVLARFRTAKISSFEGSSQAVSYTFTVPK
jgi:serine/threonine-protein kinase